MDNKRLIPYSLYLPEETYLQLKERAKHRQASSVVRDAITMILEGNDQYDAGYKQAARDILKIIDSHEMLNDLAYKDEHLADSLTDIIRSLPRLQ